MMRSAGEMQNAGDRYRASNYLVPTVIESSNRGERGLRPLLPPPA